MLGVKDPDVSRPASVVELGLEFSRGAQRDSSQDIGIEGFLLNGVLEILVRASFVAGLVENLNDLVSNPLPLLVLSNLTVRQDLVGLALGLFAGAVLGAFSRWFGRCFVRIALW